MTAIPIQRRTPADQARRTALHLVGASVLVQLNAETEHDMELAARLDEFAARLLERNDPTRD